MNHAITVLTFRVNETRRFDKMHKESKDFFSEEKKQKTLMSLSRRR
jgi:hypothetical protein